MRDRLLELWHEGTLAPTTPTTPAAVVDLAGRCQPHALALLGRPPLVDQPWPTTSTTDGLPLVKKKAIKNQENSLKPD